MDQLPFEILFEIFQYLSFADKCALRQVSSYFYNVLNDTFLNREAKLIIDNHIFGKNSQTVVQTVLDSNRTFYNWSIRRIKPFSVLYELFLNLGQNVKQLHIEACDLSEADLTTILSSCPKLTSLTFTSGAAIESIPTSMVIDSLKTLNFSNVRGLSDNYLCNILKVFPQLHALSFHNCDINFHIGTYNFYYEELDDILSNLSANVFTSRALFEIIPEFAPYLLSLDMSKTKLTDQGLKQLFKMQSFKAQAINFADCNELRKETLCRIVAWHDTLTWLNIASIHAVTDNVMQDICLNLRQLRYFNCSHLKRITNRGIIFINFLKNLVDFNISHCSNVTTNAVVLSLSATVNPTIKRLNIAYLGYESEVIAEIADCMPNLVELTVSCIGWHDLCYIYSSHQKLIKLDAACKYIQNNMITGMERIRPHRLRRLQYMIRAIQYETKKKMLPEYAPINWTTHREAILNHCTQEIDREMIADACIGHLKSLEHLNLSSQLLSNEIFYTGFRFPSLRVLKLGGTKISTKGIVIVVAKCPAIESLDISGTTVNNIGIEIITLGLKRLRYLVLRGCSKLTDQALVSICRHAHSLKVLDISDCSRTISKDMVDKVLAMPFMKEVHGRPYENLQTPGPAPPPFPL